MNVTYILKVHYNVRNTTRFCILEAIALTVDRQFEAELNYLINYRTK